MNLWVELDQEPFSLEAQFANLGPIEGIYFCVSLGEKGMLEETFSNIVRDGGSCEEKSWYENSSHLKNLKAHMRNS